MSGGWPEPVERVASVLRRAGVDARLESFAAPAATAAEAAEATGSSISQIVKTLVFMCDGRPAVALVPGDRRADAKKVAALVGAEKARTASPEQVLETTGFEAGAVAPFPLPTVWHVLIERTLLAHEELWIGAGSHTHLAAIAPSDLVNLSRAQPADLVADDT